VISGFVRFAQVEEMALPGTMTRKTEDQTIEVPSKVRSKTSHSVIGIQPHSRRHDEREASPPVFHIYTITPTSSAKPIIPNPPSAGLSPVLALK